MRSPYAGLPRAVREGTNLARSGWLHLRWYANAKRHARIRRDIRSEFDDAYYRTTYPETQALKIGPLRHYILTGWKEGKDPNETFSSSAYLAMYRDVAEMRFNPFQHYLMHGRREGRAATLSMSRRFTLKAPRAPLQVPGPPSWQEWEAMPRRVVEPPPRRAVNVVVPVYKSHAHVAATLASVLSAHNATPCECLVVNDASPEPDVAALLDRLAASGHVRLIVNPSNLGFVASVNRAIAANPHRDVVLLNADTVVHDGWLDRLLAPFTDDPAVATVTALSNNATLASYPNNAQDNAFELELPSAELDRLAAEANAGVAVDVPTGVGFCIAIRRAAIDALGAFDTETFGLGYGEECDFCLRALKAGWRNVVAGNVYVRHFGSASFGETQAQRSLEAQRLIALKHPDFPGRVGRHLAADPLLPARIMLDAERLRTALGSVSVLFVTHSRGGGIDTYLDNTRLALIAEGRKDLVDRALVLHTQRDGFLEVAPFGDRRLPYLPNLQLLNIERHKDLLGAVIARLAPELVHVNSFAGLPIAAIDRLMETLMRSGTPYWHVWHDHQPLCPRLTFLDAEDRYCGETDATRCVSCLASTSAAFEWVRVEDWRARFRAYLAGAAVVSAPSEAAALRARRLADVAKVAVHPHPEPQLAGLAAQSRRRRSDAVRNVLVLGAIGPHKGAHLIEAMLADIDARRLPLRFSFVGYTSSGAIARSPHAKVLGRYQTVHEAATRIGEVAPDLCLMPSVWPETYLFTLSLAMALGLPVAAFDLGAQGERVGAYGRGALLDRRLMDDPIAVNDALVALDVATLWARPADAAFANRSALADWFGGEASRGAAIFVDGEEGAAEARQSSAGGVAKPSPAVPQNVAALD